MRGLKAMGHMMMETIHVRPIALELSWGAESLKRIRLSWSEPGEADQPLTAEGAAVKRCLEKYLASGSVQWPDIPLGWEGLPHFSRRVLQTLKGEVEAGCWISYSGLAARSGSPGAARAVGGVMRLNPWPLIVPCHRVLSKGKGLGGFSSGLDLKHYLLRLEGVSLSSR